MKRIILPALLLLIVQSHTLLAQNKSEVSIGKIDSIYSPILKEYRKLSIHTPRDYNPADTTKRYPVIYLLDGNAHFYSMVGILHQLSAGSSIVPKMIVVAIHNTDRIRDLTPTHIEMKMGSTSFATSGGGENFMNFITRELIPHIDKSYNVSKQRMFSGHSLGGLMVIHAMIKYTDYFSRYISIDPSLWWDDQKMLKQYEQAIIANKYKGKSLFIGIANTISMDTAKAVLDTAKRMRHFQSTLQFSKLLKKTKTHGIDFDYRYYPDDTHGSVPLITQYDAMRFFFRKKSVQLKEDVLKLYTGNYKSTGGGKENIFEISLLENVLLVKDISTGKKIRFTPVSEVEFYSADENLPLKFIKDDKGNIKQALAFNVDLWNKVASK